LVTQRECHWLPSQCAKADDASTLSDASSSSSAPKQPSGIDRNDVDGLGMFLRPSIDVHSRTFPPARDISGSTVSIVSGQSGQSGQETGEKSADNSLADNSQSTKTFLDLLHTLQLPVRHKERVDELAMRYPPKFQRHIPKIIHQTAQVPAKFDAFSTSWQKVHKGEEWEYWFWTNDDIFRFVETSFPRYLKMFKSFREPYKLIQQTDVWKYLVLYQFGGVFVDLGMEALQPIGAWRNFPLVLSQEPLAHTVILNQQPRTASNAFMASVPSHPFWLKMLKEVGKVARLSVTDPVDSTGSRLLEHVLQTYEQERREAKEADSTRWEEVFPEIKVLQPETVMPLYDAPAVKAACEQLLRVQRPGVPAAIVPGDNLFAQTQQLKMLTGQDIEETKTYDKAKRLCHELKQGNFANSVNNFDGFAVFAVHHWAHTGEQHGGSDSGNTSGNETREVKVVDVRKRMSVGPWHAHMLPTFPEQKCFERQVRARADHVMRAN
jgi:mannosyltransferase OCH1-like enzyme